MKSHLFGAVCACALFVIITTTNAAVLPLEGRLPATPGGTDYQAYYDPNLNITWAADADINGADIWGRQTAWVAGLTIGGVNGWRLPSVDVNGDGAVVDCAFVGVTGCADNEMGYLYFEEGIATARPGPFSNLQFDDWHWSGTAFAPNPPQLAWSLDFHFVTGILGGSVLSVNNHAWAVHDGDVGAVPIPPAVWLFGSGLLGLIGIVRRNKAEDPDVEGHIC